MKSINQLASKLALEEGGKSQAKIGDIRQLLAKLADEINKSPVLVIGLLVGYAAKRAKKGK